METQGVGVKPHRTQQVPASTSIHSWYWKGHRSYFSCISCCRGLSELAVSLDRYNLQLVPYQCTKNAKNVQFSIDAALKEPLQRTLRFFPGGFEDGAGVVLEDLSADASTRTFRSRADASSGSKESCVSCACMCPRASGA